MTNWLEELHKQEQETTPGPWYRMAGNNTGLVAHKSGHGPFVELDEVIRFAVAFRNHARELIDATHNDRIKSAHIRAAEEENAHLLTENQKLRSLLRRSGVV